jgi:predicted phage tail protein
MRTVKLYGWLGEKYGTSFDMHVKTTQEALKLLFANFPTMRKDILDADQRIAGYEVWDGDRNIADKEEFGIEGRGDIQIIPRVQGAGANARIVVGVILVIVGVVLSVGSYGAASPYGASLVMMGIGLIAGGIAEKLAKVNTDNTAEDVADSTSYIFSGPVNNTKQGAAVAIGYGTMIVGSNVISASLTTADIPV